MGCPRISSLKSMAISTPYWESVPRSVLGPEITSAEAIRRGSPGATSTQPRSSVHSYGATFGPQAASTMLAKTRIENTEIIFFDIFSLLLNINVLIKISQFFWNFVNIRNQLDCVEMHLLFCCGYIAATYYISLFVLYPYLQWASFRIQKILENFNELVRSGQGLLVHNL